MRLLHFILSHSIFIACCAVGLCYETFLLLGIPSSLITLAFVFFSTVCSYNFYWLASKFYFTNDKNNFLKNNLTYISLLFIGAVGALYFFVNSNLSFTSVLISIMLTLLYSMPLWPFEFSKKMQNIGFVKTILLAFTWAFVTVILPAESEIVISLPTLILFSNRFLFMLMLCIIFDTRDVNIDKINGLQSLVSKLDLNKIKIIFFVILTFYLLTSVLFFYTTNSLIQVMQSILITSVLLMAFKKSLKPQNYFFYYFFIDGLMLVSLITNLILKQLF